MSDNNKKVPPVNEEITENKDTRPAQDEALDKVLADSVISEEEKKRLEKIEILDQNQKRKKKIIAALIIILVGFFVGGTVFGANYIFSYEGTEAIPVPEAEYEKIPGDFGAGSVNALLAEKPDSDYSVLNKYVESDIVIKDITGEYAADIKNYCDYMGSDFTGSLGDVLAVSSADRSAPEDGGSETLMCSHQTQYGEDFSDFIYGAGLVPDAAEITAEYAEKEDEDGNRLPDYSAAVITCSLSEIGTESDKKLQKAFGIGETDFRESVARKKFGDVSSLEFSEVTYSDPEIKITYNCAQTGSSPARRAEKDGKISKAEFSVTINLNAHLIFTGFFANLGEADIAFEIRRTQVYEFTYADFCFADEYMILDHGTETAPAYTIECGRELAEAREDIVLVSSNPDIVAVDGYKLKAVGESSEPVVITATFTLNGKVYGPDELTVFVRKNAPDKAKLSDTELTLSAGETKQVTISFKPADTTVKAARWFSTDETKVTVDDNGNITGVMPTDSPVEVYCITYDGNFRRACQVTVN